MFVLFCNHNTINFVKNSFRLCKHTCHTCVVSIFHSYKKQCTHVPPILRYVSAKKDRVTVIFSTIFQDDDDVVIGKVFMQVSSSLVLSATELSHLSCCCRSSRRVVEAARPLLKCCSHTLNHRKSYREQMLSLAPMWATSPLVSHTHTHTHLLTPHTHSLSSQCSLFI